MEIRLIDKDIYCDGEKVAQLIDIKSSQAKWNFKDFLDKLESFEDVANLADNTEEIERLEQEVYNLEAEVEEKDSDIDNLKDEVEEREADIDNLKDEIREDLTEYFSWLDNKDGEEDKEQLEQAISKWTGVIKRKWM